MNENQLIEVPQNQNYQVQQYNPDDMMKWMPIAAEFAKSGLFPQIKNPAQAFAIIQYGFEIGLTPIISLQTINIISGKPAISAQGMLSIAKSRCGVDWEIVEETDKKSVIAFHRAGKSYNCEYTIEDAKRMGLTEKDNWKKQPATMLFSRCVSKGIRRIAPECVTGLYTPEETNEFVEHRGFENAKTVEAVPQDEEKDPMDQFLQAVDNDTVYQRINAIRTEIDASIGLKHRNHSINAMNLFVKDELNNDYKYALELFMKNEQSFFKTYRTYVKDRWEAANSPKEQPSTEQKESEYEFCVKHEPDPLDAALNEPDTPLDKFSNFLRDGKIKDEFCYDYFSPKVSESGHAYKNVNAMIDSHVAFVNQDPAFLGDFEDALHMLETAQGAKTYAQAYLKWVKQPVQETI